MIYQDSFNSPIGVVTVSSNDGLTICDIAFAQAKTNQSSPVTATAKQQLQEYFAGSRREFDLPLNPHGTVFQRAVWQHLQQVPYGNTQSYGDIAAALANPKAVRAVGAANSRNPIAIVIPCHRIIGANGTLTGYAGGLDKKAWLLQHEGCSRLS